MSKNVIYKYVLQICCDCVSNGSRDWRQVNYTKIRSYTWFFKADLKQERCHNKIFQVEFKIKKNSTMLHNMIQEQTKRPTVDF